MLSTNLFKKEFTSHAGTPYDIGVAINSLANIANLDLARDCISDLVNVSDILNIKEEAFSLGCWGVSGH